MSKIVSIAKEQIYSQIVNAAKSAMDKELLPKAELTDFVIEVPSNREHGDYAVIAAMVWSRVFRNAPRKIAETIMGEVDFSGTYIEKYEIAGPGFINLF